MDKNTLKSSFGKWVSPINTKKLYEQVEENKQVYYTKKLTTEAYIKLLLLSQLQGFESLEEMSDARIDDELQKVLGFESISPSQLSRKNNEMNPDILSHLFFDLVYKTKGLQFKNGKLHAIKNH